MLQYQFSCNGSLQCEDCSYGTTYTGGLNCLVFLTCLSWPDLPELPELPGLPKSSMACLECLKCLRLLYLPGQKDIPGKLACLKTLTYLASLAHVDYLAGLACLECLTCLDCPIFLRLLYLSGAPDLNGLSALNLHLPDCKLYLRCLN
jgi:hypothetical protein